MISCKEHWSYLKLPDALISPNAGWGPAHAASCPSRAGWGYKHTFGSSAGAVWLPRLWSPFPWPACKAPACPVLSPQHSHCQSFSSAEKRKGESTEHSHPEVGSCSITHYLEDLRALPFNYSADVLKSVTQFRGAPAKARYTHPPTAASEAHPAPPAGRRVLPLQPAWLSPAAEPALLPAQHSLGSLWEHSQLPSELLLRAAAIKMGKSTPTWRKMLFPKKATVLENAVCHIQPPVPRLHVLFSWGDSGRGVRLKY